MQYNICITQATDTLVLYKLLLHYSAQEVFTVWTYLSHAGRSTDKDNAAGISRRHTTERKTSEELD